MSIDPSSEDKPRLPWQAVLMVAPAVVALLLIGLYPLLYALVLSVQKYHLTQTAGNGTFVWFTNYVSVFRDPDFWSALGRSGLFLVISLSLQIVFGVAIALFLEQNQWRRLTNVVQIALVVPIAMTPAVIGLLARLIYNRDFGLLNYLIGLVGFEKRSWLGEPSLAMTALIATDVWQWTPFAALVMISSLTTVPRESLEAAKLDAPGWWSVVRHVQLPYLLPGITAVLIVRTADILKLFDMPYILTRGGPGVSTELTSLYVQRVGFRIFNMSLASAQAIVLLVLCIGLSRLYLRFVYHDAEANG